VTVNVRATVMSNATIIVGQRKILARWGEMRKGSVANVPMGYIQSRMAKCGYGEFYWTAQLPDLESFR